MRRKRGLWESGKDRRALAADAGLGSVSIGSVLAGVLVAYGAFAVLVGIAAAILDAVNFATDIASTDYEQLGIAGGLVVAGILLASYLFGGYVAGRMARRAGTLNGLLVAVLGLAIAGAVAALVRASDAETINTSLRSLGVPTTAEEYGQAFTVAGIASLAAILLGSLMGGSRGERWHGKLLARAADPTIGTEAEARKRAQADLAKAEAERTIAFDRARTSNPARSRRVDRDALSAEERRVLDEHDGDRDRAAAVVGANGHGHNAAARGNRVLTGRRAPSSSSDNEGGDGADRAATTDPVIEDARAGRPWTPPPAVSDSRPHSRFRRRAHRR